MNDTVIYCRTASGGVDEIANALQLDSLNQYGQSMGYSPSAAYCDWNESGKTLDRPYLQKLLADVRAGNDQANNHKRPLPACPELIPPV